MVSLVLNTCVEACAGPFLTFTDGSMVTPGCKDLGHPLATDGFTALENIVFSTTELHHTANATHKYTHTHRQTEGKGVRYTGNEEKPSLYIHTDPYVGSMSE